MSVMAFQGSFSCDSANPSLPYLVCTVVSSNLFAENVNRGVPVHLLLHSSNESFSDSLHNAETPGKLKRDS